LIIGLPQKQEASIMANVVLSEQDAKNILIIIDTCSKRGAFEGAELAGVGQTRNNVVIALQELSEIVSKGEDAQ